MAKQNKSILPSDKPRRGGARRVLILLGLIVIGALAIVYALVQPSFTADERTVEAVTIAEDTIETITTDRSYSGQVLLTISGTGSATAGYESDAFYLFTQAGTVLDEPILEPYNVILDETAPLLALNLVDNPPPYNPDHVYTLCYMVGTPARPIQFRIDDKFAGDTDRTFRIRVEGDIRRMGDREYYGCQS